MTSPPKQYSVNITLRYLCQLDIEAPADADEDTLFELAEKAIPSEYALHDVDAVDVYADGNVVASLAG